MLLSEQLWPEIEDIVNVVPVKVFQPLNNYGISSDSK